MEIMEVLRLLSDDANATAERFLNNEGLMRRMVLKFPQDQTYEQLSAALEKQEYAEAERFAHTLKGVAGNLGFTYLHRAAADVVNSIREEDFEAALNQYHRVTEEYDKVLGILRKLD